MNKINYEGGKTMMSKAKFLAASLLLVTGVSFNAEAGSIGVPSQPAPANCVSKAELQEIAGHFNQFRNIANNDFCYDGSQQSNLLQAIMFMRHTQYPSTMPKSSDELFSGKFASNWYNYFIGRIDESNIQSSCPKGVIAYVYSFGGKTMYVCPMGLTDIFSSLDRASVFMHEARHIDGFPHTTCSRGPRKGLNGACDDQISDGGSYAVTVETYAQLGQYAQDIHPALKAYSKASAVIYADEAFEIPVKINRTKQLLVVTQNRDFYAMDLSTRKTTKLGQLSSSGKIVKRAEHMILFPSDRNLKAQYVFANNEGEIAQSPGELITEYNGQTPAERANLVDLHISAQWTARVYKNKIRFACDPNSPVTKDLDIPSGMNAANLVYPMGYARDMYSVNLVMDNNSVYDIGCNNKSPFIRASSTKFDQNYTRIYKIDNEVFGLTANGKLYAINGTSSTVIAADLGAIAEIAPRATFEFFESKR